MKTLIRGIYFLVGIVGLISFGWVLGIQMGLFPNTLHVNTNGSAIGVVIMVLVMCCIILAASLWLFK